MVEFSYEAIWSWVLFAGRFLITVWISLLVMGLLISSISPWFSFGKLYFSKNLKSCSSCSFYWHRAAGSSLLWSFVFLCSLLWSLHFHLILFIWFFSLCFLMSLLDFLYFPDSVLEGYIFLRICLFLPSCLFYWHIVADSSLLWSFIFLCCL